MDWSASLLDALLAGLASVGFAAVSQPPKRAYLPIAILAGLGHGLRKVLMSTGGTFDIVMASFIAAVLIGFGSFFFGKRIRTPMTITFIPALLPMIPGMYAYRAVLSLVLFLHHHEHSAIATNYMQDFLTNFTIASMVVFVLGIGAILPELLLHKYAHSLARSPIRDTTNDTRRTPPR